MNNCKTWESIFYKSLKINSDRMKKLVFLATAALILSFVNAKTYKNPVINGTNAPDPGVIYHEGFYYAALTSRDN